MSAAVHLVGLGAVSPAGVGARVFWRSLFEDPAPPERHAVPGLPEDGKSLRHGYALGASGAGAGSRFDAVALQAATEALRDAAQHGVSLEHARVGLVLGTGAGDAEAGERQRLAGEPVAFEQCNPYASVTRIAAQLPMPVNGPCFTIANACSAGLYALVHAADLLRAGCADAMVVIGAELLSRVTQAGFQRMTALAPDRCRPFDARRCGTVLGEGVAALVLLSEGLMRRQAGVDAYARLTGIGLSCDAHHVTAPQPEGRDIRAAVQRALQHSGAGGFVDLVVPHGTGTPINDRIESEMLAEVLGAGAGDIAILPIKSHIGHGAGASGTFSTLAAALALYTGQLPPVRHIETPDPMVPLRFRDQPSQLPAGRVLRALVNAYGFGGNNASLVLERTCA